MIVLEEVGVESRSLSITPPLHRLRPDSVRGRAWLKPSWHRAWHMSLSSEVVALTKVRIISAPTLVNATETARDGRPLEIIYWPRTSSSIALKAHGKLLTQEGVAMSKCSGEVWGTLLVW